MPNIKSAKKRMRLSRVANEYNRARRSQIRTAIKRVEEAGDTASAQDAYRQVQVLLDRAATNRLIHPKTVARIKSRLAQKANR